MCYTQQSKKSSPFPKLITQQQSTTIHLIQNISKTANLSRKRAQSALNRLLFISAHREIIKDGKLGILRWNVASDLTENAYNTDLLDKCRFARTVRTKDELVRCE